MVIPSKASSSCLTAVSHLDIPRWFHYNRERFAPAPLRLGSVLSAITGTNRHTRPMEFNGTPRTDAFTQGCRDFVRSLTYETILACTVYGSPMLFMIGPAVVVMNHPLIVIVLHSVLGFGMSWMIHSMGHRLLAPLPLAPKAIHVTKRIRLPVKLSVKQFVWMLEILVAAGVCCGIAARRLFAEDVMAGVLLLMLGGALYFLPVYLTKLWSERYYPKLTLCGPTEDVINNSFRSLRSFLP